MKKNVHPSRDITADEIEDTLISMADPVQREILCRFFKTGKGEYGEGDRFLGLKVPRTRAVVREGKLRVSLPEICKLLYSPWHEARLCGFLLLVEEMNSLLPRGRRHDTADSARQRREIAEFYLSHARQANNWDLVDLSAPYILGQWLLHPLPGGHPPDREILDRLAASDNLWEQRIAIVSTAALIRSGEFDDTFRIARRLLSHPHNLIHKAVGWMLREVGKRDLPLMLGFLAEEYSRLPRTTLRYAIERLPEDERRRWLHGCFDKNS